HYEEAQIPICGLWVMDKVTKAFTRMFTIKSPGMTYGRLIGFRKNGEAIMRALDYDLDCDDIDVGVSKLICKREVYEPSSGHNNAIGTKGSFDLIFMTSYTETLLLLDQPR
nr:hypothetical protein [Tanacetum cinerariifolium]